MSTSRLCFTLAAALLMAGYCQASEAVSLYSRASEHYAAGQYAEALGGYEKAAAAEPENAEFRRMIGVCLARLRRTEEALAALDAVPRLQSQGTAAEYARSLAYALRNGLSPEQFISDGAVARGVLQPSTYELFYRPRISALPDADAENLRRLKAEALKKAAAVARAPDDMEVQLYGLGPGRTTLTPTWLLEQELEKIRGNVRDWAETMLNLMAAYQQAGLPDAARAAFAIVTESPFLRSAPEPEVITRLPRFAEAQQVFSPGQ